MPSSLSRSISRSPARYMPRTGGSLMMVAKEALGGIEPDTYIDFTTNRALWNRQDVGAVSNIPRLSFSRGSTGYAVDSAGVLVPFASGAMRLTNLGLLIEISRTNLALWSNDWTNAAWVKTNVTATQNQIGPDLVANGATLLTATSALGTVLQSITSASATRMMSVWIKRITGSGVIDMTVDGGVTWTPITVTGSWARQTLLQVAVTNPNIGLRFNTSGDAVAVSFAQIENTGSPTSPIPTTTVSVTRASDTMAIATSDFAYPMSVWAECLRYVATGTSEYAFQLDDGTANERTGLFLAGASSNQPGVVQTIAGVTDFNTSIAPSVSVGATYKNAARLETNNCIQARSPSTLGVADTVAAMPVTPNQVSFRSAAISAPMYGYIKRIAIFKRALSNANLQTITA